MNKQRAFKKHGATEGATSSAQQIKKRTRQSQDLRSMKPLTPIAPELERMTLTQCSTQSNHPISTKYIMLSALFSYSLRLNESVAFKLYKLQSI